MKKKLVIVGAGEFAEIAYEYFTVDSDFEVAGFSVNRSFIKDDRFLGLPVVPLEEVEQHFPPGDYYAYVAVTFTQLNRVRRRLFFEIERKGYEFASYVSSRATVWRTANIGRNVFIFEHNNVQHGCTIEDNVVLWSGNHIGHRSTIAKHAYLSSHVVVSGYCHVGEASFIGVNATLVDNIKVAADNFVAAGALIAKSTQPRKMYRGVPAEAAEVDLFRFLKVPAEADDPSK